MTRNEAFTQLISKRGWYKPLGITRQTADLHKQRFLRGKNVSYELITNALKTTGYILETEEQWIKAK
jgi:hypothetical protein